MAVPEKTDFIIPTVLPIGIFRTYDIRGPVNEEGLTADIAFGIGRAIGSEAREKHQPRIAVGCDGRLSSPMLCQALMKGLSDSGLEVLYIGMVPTPLLYFATHRLDTRSGVMVTGSHNPGDHNGFKIVLNGKTLTTDRIQAIRNRIIERRFTEGRGKITPVDVIKDYELYIQNRIHLERPMKVVVDCGNGVAGKIAPKLYRLLGCQVIDLFCEVDGHFPNHHPDPSVPENMASLIKAVQEHQADIGFAFDGDADRLGVVTDRGEIIWPDRQMMLFSEDVLSRLPGSDIIFDVKCSRLLPEIIRRSGGNPVMSRTGHSLLKAKLFELNAPLAGEMSGHIFFNDDWFGFDDGLYAGARLLRILSRDPRSSSEVFSSLPNSVNTPELKVPLSEDQKAEFMKRLVEEGHFEEGSISTLDGIRVDYPDGFGLVRPSNTSPYLILRFEANTKERLLQIQEKFRKELLKIDKNLKLPF